MRFIAIPRIFHSTTVYSFTQFVFRLRLFTAYITTAKISIMVFYYSFQDYILGFKICFSLFRCSGFMHLLCTIVGHDISNSPLHPYYFTHTVLDLLGRISGQTCLHLCFLHSFLYISLAHMGAHFLIYKVATPHLATNNKNQNSYQSALLPYLLAQRFLTVLLAPVQYYPHRIDRAQSSHI